MPSDPIIGAHFKPSGCLCHKVEMTVGDIGGFIRMRGWFWTKMGLDLGKHWNMARDELFKCYYNTKGISCKSYKGLKVF